ncbi:luciferase-like monooxygenase [Salana multivorans]|uniref:Luciferase-like monooxygenase n=1 Tax=Salana multivorans TaxID=120377 RepID=A0A3N2D9I1_9MICO|nr:LLM class flavin-dependent oxidoreductase [Salana multivorans]ROR96439.1 luciferase-like monooxygenase [Salana multivorans]
MVTPRLDVVLSPFGGDATALLDAAIRAEDAGLDGVWTFDHVSSLASIGAPGSGASRDPFAVLGAVAARTTRVRLGTLVANLHNRLPEQLALAIDTLASLAPARVVCGVGSGAGVGSPFAREDEALGRVPEPAAVRRAMLADYVRRLDETWAGRGVPGVVSGPRPPIVVGAGSATTLRLAALDPLVDGVNVVTGLTPDLSDTVGLVRGLVAERPFEVSVFLDAGGVRLEDLRDHAGSLPVPAGVDRLTFLVRP